MFNRQTLCVCQCCDEMCYKPTFEDHCQNIIDSVDITSQNLNYMNNHAIEMRYLPLGY